MSIFHFYGNVPWKLHHLAINVNTPIFLSYKCFQNNWSQEEKRLNNFKSFSEIFFCLSVCSPSSRTWSLLNGQNLSPMASMSFLNMGAKSWPKYGISLRSVLRGYKKNLLSFYDIFSNKLLLEKVLTTFPLFTQYSKNGKIVQ